MKIWNSYGSEHSANLVMIGHFKDAGSAEDAKDIIEELQAFVGTTSVTEKDDRYSEEARNFLGRIKFHSIGPSELEQFNYSFNVEHKKEKVIITTDEIEVSALMKLLFEKGARIEIYSAHEHSGTSLGRDTTSNE